MKVIVHFNVYYPEFLTKCPFGLVANLIGQCHRLVWQRVALVKSISMLTMHANIDSDFPKLLQPLWDIWTDGLGWFSRPGEGFADLVGIQYCSYSKTALNFQDIWIDGFYRL